MAEKFHTELDRLRLDTLEMAHFARDMLNESVAALILEDPVNAAQVVARKKKLREATFSLEERAYQLIAMYQPMAKDMRVIVCTLKMIGAAERIGRYGKDIANMVKHIRNQPQLLHPIPLPHMAEQVIGMIDDALTAYREDNKEPVKEFSSRDDTVDALWHSIFRETLTIMMENPKTITRCTYYIMVARYLERSADHACKMAENIHYMVSGERIEIR